MQLPPATTSPPEHRRRIAGDRHGEERGDVKYHENPWVEAQVEDMEGYFDKAHGKIVEKASRVNGLERGAFISRGDIRHVQAYAVGSCDDSGDREAGCEDLIDQSMGSGVMTGYFVHAHGLDNH